MSAQPAPLESVATVHPLKRLWESGPSGWNHALTRPGVLIPFFIFAALVPLGLQYVEDNSSWTDAQFWSAPEHPVVELPPLRVVSPAAL